jgi:hypothetical protein
VVEAVIPWSERKAISRDDFDRLTALTRLTFRDVRPLNGVVPTVRFTSIDLFWPYPKEAPEIMDGDRGTEISIYGDALTLELE